MYCPKCGTENSDNSSFCKKCGSPLKRYVVNPETNSSVNEKEATSEMVSETTNIRPVIVNANAQATGNASTSDSNVEFKENNQTVDSSDHIDETVETENLSDFDEYVEESTKSKKIIPVIIGAIVLIGVIVGGYMYMTGKFNSSQDSEIEETSKNQLSNSFGDLRAIDIAGHAKRVEYFLDNDENSGFNLYFDKDGNFITFDGESTESDDKTKLLYSEEGKYSFTIDVDRNDDVIREIEYTIDGYGWHLEPSRFDDNGNITEFNEGYENNKNPMNVSYLEKDDLGNWTKMQLSFKSQPINPHISDNLIIKRKIEYYKDGEDSYKVPKISDAEILKLVNSAAHFDLKVMTPDFHELTSRFLDSPGTSKSLWEGGFGDGPSNYEDGDILCKRIIATHSVVKSINEKLISNDYNTINVIFTYDIVFDDAFESNGKNKADTYTDGTAMLKYIDGAWLVDDIGSAEGSYGGIIVWDSSFSDEMNKFLKEVDSEIKSGKLIEAIDSDEYYDAGMKQELRNTVYKYQKKYLQ